DGLGLVDFDRVLRVAGISGEVLAGGAQLDCRSFSGGRRRGGAIGGVDARPTGILGPVPGHRGVAVVPSQPVGSRGLRGRSLGSNVVIVRDGVAGKRAATNRVAAGFAVVGPEGRPDVRNGIAFALRGERKAFVVEIRHAGGTQEAGGFDETSVVIDA